MSISATGSRYRSWLLLLLAACLIAPIAESVHGVAIERLGVPYPYTPGLPAVVSIVNLVVRLAASAFFVRVLLPEKWRVSPLAAAVLGGVLTLMLNETMRVVWITSAIAQSFPAALLTAVPQLLFAADVMLIVFLAAAGVRLSALAVGIVVISIFSTLYGTPWIQSHIDIWNQLYFSNVVEHYTLPYPAFIKFRILSGFLEPVLATLVLISLCWNVLPGTVLKRSLWFTLFLLFLRGRVVQFCVSSFWVKQHFPVNFLATSQFFFETAVLGLLSSLAWFWCNPLAGERAGRDDGFAWRGEGWVKRRGNG